MSFNVFKNDLRSHIRVHSSVKNFKEKAQIPREIVNITTASYYVVESNYMSVVIK